MTELEKLALDVEHGEAQGIRALERVIASRFG